ncbi:hypothetical protein BV898_07060 [Hypsibius exemplaris]|uniref:Dehydrogenase/reductase SDR family member 11 n=1 Tax=Hypsibius exemplaris TaxID=2072580 RepID=A0A1W0WUH5_HYPEX|nr:hypothetical protein BV898_07060 [Hypsibius exemplaris]
MAGMLQLNILSTTICTKETLRLLEKDGITTGHVININSIAGHRSIEGFKFTPARSNMLTALTKALHVELAKKKSKIRVTSLSPGLCSDIADAVLYVLSVPLSVVITELTIVPNGEMV